VTSAPARPRLVELDARDIADRLAEALHVYVAAMGYPPGTARQRRSLWLDHVRRPGWRAVGWLDPAGPLIGIAYGYTGGPGQWWYEEVRRGVRPRHTAMTDDYFELTELHVRPRQAGRRAPLAKDYRPAAGCHLSDGAHPDGLAPAGWFRDVARSPVHRRRAVRRAGARALRRHHAATGRSASTSRSRADSGRASFMAPRGTTPVHQSAGSPPVLCPRLWSRSCSRGAPGGHAGMANGTVGGEIVIATRRPPGRSIQISVRGDRRRRRRLRLPPGGLHRVAAALLRTDLRPARPALGGRRTGR
jgi:hypothetical protein